MAFWIIALGLAGLVALPLLAALLRGRELDGAPAATDIAVYRDQLAEVDREVARGILAAEEAERARTEISRRLLDADRALATAGAAGAAPKAASRIVAGGLALLLVGGAAWLYGRIGAPGYPDLPLQTRIELADEARAERPGQAAAEAALGPIPPRPADPAYVDLVARLRATVAERPNDPEGLALLARHEAALGNFGAAYAAQARLIEVKGAATEAADHSDLAELLILAAGGYVSPEAEAALTRALTRDPRLPRARYYTGLLFAQTGRPDLAFRFWATLLAEGPPDAPWIAPIRAEIEDIALRAGQHNFRLPPLEIRGPSQADIEAAGEMTEAERSEMIRSMVEGLAARLAAEGGPAEDWARLIRALGVLGEADRAAPILAEARVTFADDPSALDVIEAAARDAGLGAP